MEINNNEISKNVENVINQIDTVPHFDVAEALKPFEKLKGSDLHLANCQFASEMTRKFEDIQKNRSRYIAFSKSLTDLTFTSFYYKLGDDVKISD